MKGLTIRLRMDMLRCTFVKRKIIGEDAQELKSLFIDLWNRRHQNIFPLLSVVWKPPPPNFIGTYLHHQTSAFVWTSCCSHIACMFSVEQNSVRANHFPLLSLVSIARGCRAQLFVRGKLVRLLTVFLSSIARSPEYCTCSGCLHVHAQHSEEEKNRNEKCVENE
jgi:hypothetical protein